MTEETIGFCGERRAMTVPHDRLPQSVLWLLSVIAALASVLIPPRAPAHAGKARI